MKNNLALFAFAILSLGLLFWTKAHDHTTTTKNSSEKQPQEYMVRVFVSVFEANGALKNELSAGYWAYLPDLQISQLTNPHLTLYKPDGTTWLIDAKEGRVIQPKLGAIEQIRLQKQVVIERPATKTAILIKLETEEIQYHPKKEYAESEQFITMTKPGLKITGTGLRAFLDQGFVELLRDVKTHYTLTH